MNMTAKTTAALTAALFMVPMLAGTTAANAGHKSKFGFWFNGGDQASDVAKCDKDEGLDQNRGKNYCDINDDYEEDGGRYSNVQVMTVGHRNRNRSRKICKRPVVGIGYGTSKSLARANAVQAWSREARKRYGRTYRLRNATVISAIRCQYNGDRDYGNFKRRSRRFDMPGEAGNPNHNWNCSVNAKPCYTKTSSNGGYNEGPSWKRSFCRRYARKALRQQRRNIRLGCEYNGPKWHRNYRRHMRQCMRTPMFRNFRTIRRHQRRLRQCR